MTTLRDNHWQQQLDSVLGKSADGCIGYETYAPTTAQRWATYVRKARRRPLWRRVLRWVRRWVVSH